MANTEYITIQGDRWDSIALKAYGDATQISPIQDANPNIPLQDTFSGGVRLIIPILEDAEDATTTELLPPWKRVPADMQAKTDQATAIIDKVTSTNNLASFDKSFD